jgi:serine protease
VANIVKAAMDGLDWVPGEVIVKFRDELPEFVVGQLASRVLPRERPTRVTPLGDAFLLEMENKTDVESVVAVLGAQPEVEYAEPNYLHHLTLTPNDPRFSAQWNLSTIGMETAWDIAPSGAANVTVAIIDSGLAFLDTSFLYSYWNGRTFSRVSVPFAAADDLITAGRVTSPYDFFWNDSYPVDLGGHGTHVAGTIGQLTNNGKGVAGIAYGVKLMPLKVCFGHWDAQFWYGELGWPGWVDTDTEGCDTADEVRAIRYAADNGAKVINMSLGGSTPSIAVRDALTYAVQKGVFVAISAGNSYENGNPTQYPAAYAKEIEGVVAVGAVGRNLSRSYYSNTGSYLELAAPGGDLRGGTAGGILQQTLNGAYFDYPPSRLLVPRFNVLTEASYQGTSMAAPHVAGLAALLVSRGINRPEAIEAALKRFARDIGATGRDDEYGYGLIDARATLRGLGVAR